MGIDLSEFRDSFFVEAAEHLDAMEAALLQLDSAPANRELLNTIFRAAHTIKGGSATFGMQSISRFTHVLENLLDRLREGSLQVTENLTELLFDSIDVIQGLLQAEKAGTAPPENIDKTLGSLQAVVQASIPVTQASSIKDASTAAAVATDSNAKSTATGLQLYTISFKPSTSFFMSGQDPLLLLRQLAEMGTITSSRLEASQLPGLLELDPQDCHVGWILEFETNVGLSSIEDVFAFIDNDSQLEIRCKSAAPPAPEGTRPTEVVTAKPALDAISSKPSPVAPTRAAGTSDTETVRVDRARLDELINQIGELVIGVSMVEQEVLANQQGSESPAMIQLGKIVRDLQELSLSLRMVPIAATFQKMARVVHDVGRKLGKQIDFVTEGDDTELDKSVVDKIGDPLIHMVRNAADHGIESPAVRAAAGKTPVGRVLLRAYQQGGNIFIELSDDGRGLDRRAIVGKAIEKGLISSAENLSDADICNMIFQPGFSTAKEITDVSGRGVGMDVVRRNVEELQGSVQVKSIEGQGSKITVRLPLTLAILDGLLVQVTSEVYVIPLLSVVESISITQLEIRELVGTGSVILLRGEVIPVIGLAKLLQQGNDSSGDDSREDTKRLLVIVEEQGRRFALVVDELVGQQQVVIKNLEANFRKVQGVAGATILGDGCVALILDINGIASLHNERAQLEKSFEPNTNVAATDQSQT